MNETKKPVNTTEETKRDPTGFLIAAMAMGSSEAIYAQEARGQRDFVESTTLPTDIQGDGKSALEKAGVKFIGPVEGDAMFQYVELPPGWRKSPTDHSMWTELLDDKGRKRAQIFYKAAFYDRSAFMRVVVGP